MPPTFHIARLNRYTPNFSGVGQKLTWCQQFGLQIFPKWGDAEKPPQKNPFFRCFFWQNKFSRPNSRLLPIACHIFLESYDTQLSFKCILRGVRVLLENRTQLSTTSQTLTYLQIVLSRFGCEASLRIITLIPYCANFKDIWFTGQDPVDNNSRG